MKKWTEEFQDQQGKDCGMISTICIQGKKNSQQFTRKHISD